MKRIKSGDKLNCKVQLPKDLHWKLLGALASDLGLLESYPEISEIVRSRDVFRLMTFLGSHQPRCMLETTGTPVNEELFYRRYQLGAFLKKFPFPGEDTLTPAVEKFKQAEYRCQLYNSENYRALYRVSGSHPDYLGVISEIQKDILDCLGAIPDLSYIFGHAKHGPGVSLGNQFKGGKCTSFYKVNSLPYTVTQGTLPLARECIETDPRWIGALDDWYRNKFKIPFNQGIDVDHFWNQVFSIVHHNKLTSVPKTAEIDRFIAIEPLMNVFLQIGVDRLIRSSMKKQWGYDLNTQSRNQELAESGSLCDDLVTLDLRMASETVSLKICEIYLPPAWYDLLLDLRSPAGVFKRGDIEQVFKFNKISSMGNGYTFALESLIFAAIVRCAIRRTKSERISAVYGDDLIIPKTAHKYCVELLQLSGFSINKEKSFDSGPFRESCGADFYSGTNVRPLFLKRKLSTVQDLFYVHNSLHVLEEDKPWQWNVDFSTTKSLILKYVPKYIQRTFYGPRLSDTLDTYLFSDRRLRHRNKYGQLVIMTVMPKAKRYVKTRAKSSKNFGQYFFLKLLATFGHVTPPNKWEYQRLLETQGGNQFWVTRRGSVTFSVAEKVAYY